VLRISETSLSRLAFLFLGLAISVFTWGLQYKLSLYDPPQAISHQIPEAKLISKNEQTVEAKNPILDVSGASAKAVQLILSSIFLLISVALNLLHAPVSVERERDAQLPWHVERFASLNAFFFRPPPALA
jgi:hypothetical protein